jgi:hypothetical protein
MGSRGKSKFTRARGAVKSVDTEETLCDVLHHFSEALAIVETVARAFDAAENSGECASAGSEIATLRQGLVALQAVYNEFDLAIGRSDV